MNGLAVKLQLNQELAMKFCACIDFVIILYGVFEAFEVEEFEMKEVYLKLHYFPWIF